MTRYIVFVPNIPIRPKRMLEAGIDRLEPSPGVGAPTRTLDLLRPSVAVSYRDPWILRTKTSGNSKLNFDATEDCLR
jgi:hypothetical protein